MDGASVSVSPILSSAPSTSERCKCPKRRSSRLSATCCVPDATSGVARRSAEQPRLPHRFQYPARLVWHVVRAPIRLIQLLSYRMTAAAPKPTAAHDSMCHVRPQSLPQSCAHGYMGWRWVTGCSSPLSPLPLGAPVPRTSPCSKSDAFRTGTGSDEQCTVCADRLLVRRRAMIAVRTLHEARRYGRMHTSSCRRVADGGPGDLAVHCCQVGGGGTKRKSEY